MVFEAALQDAATTTATFLPRVIGAILVLIVGWFIGRAVGRVVSVLTDRTPIDRMTLDTPIGDMMGGTEEDVNSAFGTIAKWFVYALAFLAAADVLAIAMLSEWISMAVAYLPAFFGGLLIIILGFIVADFVGDMIERTRAATDTMYTTYFADGVRIFLYFTVIVVGLDTMGVNVEILYILAGAVAFGIALAIALGVGIAAGWGSKDYVADHIDDWVERGRHEAMDHGADEPGPERG